METQILCPLFALPAELRSQIYFYSLISPTPIIDATVGPSIQPQNQKIPPLGTTILRTCRRIYSEADVGLLYQENEFSFTRPGIAAAFLDGIPLQRRHLLTTLTLDLRQNVGRAGSPNEWQVNEWGHYLCCGSPDQLATGNARCMSFGRLHLLSHTPPLRTVVLDLRYAQSKTVAAGVGQVEQHMALQGWWGDCFQGIAATAQGLEVRVRMFDVLGRPREVLVPGRVAREGKDESERKAMIQQWTVETFGEMVASRVLTGVAISLSSWETPGDWRGPLRIRC